MVVSSSNRITNGTLSAVPALKNGELKTVVDALREVEAERVLLAWWRVLISGVADGTTAGSLRFPCGDIFEGAGICSGIEFVIGGEWEEGFFDNAAV